MPGIFLTHISYTTYIYIQNATYSNTLHSYSALYPRNSITQTIF